MRFRTNVNYVNFDDNQHNILSRYNHPNIWFFSSSHPLNAKTGILFEFNNPSQTSRIHTHKSWENEYLHS